MSTADLLFSERFPEPQVGLGTFPFASPFSPVSEETVADIVDEYLENGGCYIDTAPTYADGKVEGQLGRLLHKYPRESFFINTSCGYIPDGKSYRISGKAVHVREDLKGSLERLQLDYVDSYISHIPDLNTPFGETVEALQRAKEDGLVRHIGVSNVTYDQLVEYCRYGRIEIVQNRLSHINRSITGKFHRFCLDNDISIVAYQVIERGLLTRKPIDAPGPTALKPAPTDLRSRKPEFQDEPLQIIYYWVKHTLCQTAAAYKLSVPAFSIAWALSQPAVRVAQVGSTDRKQLKALAEARNAPRIDPTSALIVEAYAELERRAQDAGFASVRAMLGLEGRDPLSGLSASGR
jgi:methylglyoxal reductase